MLGASGHDWYLTESDRTLVIVRLVLHCSVSGHNLNVLMTVEIGRSAFEAGDKCRASLDQTLGVLHPVNSTGAFGHPKQCPVKGYNGSISWRILFKPHCWL